jgi:hypothetical protein
MAYNGQVRFKTGLLVGLAVGYYYGAKAGRQRYQQIDHYLAQVRDSDAYRELRDQVMTLVDDSVARARGAVGDVGFGGTSTSSTEERSPYDYSGDPTLN